MSETGDKIMRTLVELYEDQTGRKYECKPVTQEEDETKEKTA